MQWPYEQWGADAVLAAHDHLFERIEQDGLLYFVNGAGGNGLYGIGSTVSGECRRYSVTAPCWMGCAHHSAGGALLACLSAVLMHSQQSGWSCRPVLVVHCHQPLDNTAVVGGISSTAFLAVVHAASDRCSSFLPLFHGSCE